MLFLVPVLATSQTGIEVIPERNSFLLGEPIRLNITITSAKPDSALVPDTLGHFEVLERKPLKTNSTNGLATTTQELVITSFDSGRWQVPPLPALNSGFVSAAFELEVMTLPADSIKPYSDISELSNMALPQLWWQKWWVWALVLLAIGLALWWFFAGRKKRNNGGWGKPGGTAKSLLQQLDQLEADWQNQAITNPQLGEALAQLLKQHLAQQGIFGHSKTGEELIVQCQALYAPALWQQLGRTLHFVNALRFGKFTALPAEGLAAIDTMRQAMTPTPAPAAPAEPLTTLPQAN